MNWLLASTNGLVALGSRLILKLPERIGSGLPDELDDELDELPNEPPNIEPDELLLELMASVILERSTSTEPVCAKLYLSILAMLVEREREATPAEAVF